VFIIGIDPHKGSHTAVAIDGDERLVGEVMVRADRRQRERLLRWASEFEPRLWAVEGATGTGALLAQQLVGAGETVLDVPPALSARARLLDSGHKDKTDPYDARSAAIVALRNRNLRVVTLEDHRQILRLLARRHHQLTAGRTREICRLHAVLCEMTEGGLTKNLSAKRAASELRKLRPSDAIGIERKRIAVEFLDEVRRHDLALVELHRRIDHAVKAACTSVTRRARCRPDRRVLPHRLQRRGSSVPDRGPLRALQRDRTDRSLQRTARSAPAQSERQPAAEPRDPHRRARTDQSQHTRPRLLPQQASPREEPQRGNALPQTPHQRRRLPTTPRRRRPLKTNRVREDNQGRL